MIPARTSLALGGLVAVLAVGPPPLAAQDPAAVWVTTDPARVAACALLGSETLAAPNGLDLLRSEAARRGADVLRLTQLSERGIAGDFYRCGPKPATTMAPPPSPTATPGPVPAASVPAPVTPRPRRSSRSTPAPLGTAERQRSAQEELETLKAAVVVVSDPALAGGCEKRGEVKGPGATEDSLREAAVVALANVVVMRRGESGEISGELFRCPRVDYQRLKAAPPLAPSR